MRRVDAVIEMLDDLRRERPPFFLADEFTAWQCSVGQTIAALPTRMQRWAATVLVADDLCEANPGWTLAKAYQWTLDHIYSATVTMEDVNDQPTADDEGRDRADRSGSVLGDSAGRATDTPASVPHSPDRGGVCQTEHTE